MEYSRAKGSDDFFGRDSYKNSTVNEALYSVVHVSCFNPVCKIFSYECDLCIHDVWFQSLATYLLT